MTPLSWWRGNKILQSQYALSLSLILLSLPNVLALQVVSESNCTNSCLSTITSYTTNGSDITCHDTDYNSSVPGGAFRDCVSCEVQSEAFDSQTGQTDLGWAFYNMRYTLDWCIFDYPQSRNQSVSNTCTASCAPISNALETNLLTPNASSTYDYCRDPNFLPNVGACALCYKIIPNQLYLSNFLNTLQYACQNQPAPTQPFYIKPNNIFTWNPPSNFSNITTMVPSSDGGSGLSHNAKIALVISIPVGAFVVLSLLFAWLFVSRHNNPPTKPQSVVNRRSYYNEKHISKSSVNWNRPPRQGFDNSRSNGAASPRPVGYPAPLKPQKVDIPAPLRPQKSNSSIPFSKVFGSPMFDQQMPTPLRTQKSNQSIPFLQPTVYSPPPIPERKKGPSLFPRPERPLGPPSGLVSWERIAIQNAQIRASQGPSPSPVSPLTAVKVVQLPRSTGHRPSVPSRHQSPFRHGSPFLHNSSFRYDPPFRQDSLIPLYRQDSQTQTLFRRPSSSTLGTTHLQNYEPRPSRRHRSHKNRHSNITEAQPPQREGTPGQGEALSSDAPPIPISAYNSTIAPMMPLSPIRPVSPILKSCPTTRPGTAKSDTTSRTSALMPETATTTTYYKSDMMRPGTLPPDSFRSDYMRADTPNPDDGILARRSGVSGVMRTGSGKSRGSRKEVRWSKDVDYEDGWGTTSRKSKSSKSGSGKSVYCGWNE